MSSLVPSTRNMVELYCLAPFEVRYGHLTYLQMKCEPKWTLVTSMLKL